MRRRHREPGEAASRPIWSGGINLLPYRARERRQQRICRLRQGAGAVACACVWAALWCLPDLREAQRTDARRAEIERSLTSVNATSPSRVLAAGAAQMPALMAARALLLDGFDILGRLPYDGVRLHALHGDAQGFSMRIEARDPAAAQAWLARLRSRWPAQVFDIEDLRAAADVSGVRASRPARMAETEGNAQALMLTVRMRGSEQPHADGGAHEPA